MGRGRQAGEEGGDFVPDRGNKLRLADPGGRSILGLKDAEILNQKTFLLVVFMVSCHRL